MVLVLLFFDVSFGVVIFGFQMKVKPDLVAPALGGPPKLLEGMAFRPWIAWECNSA
jgi:hypothetical protein